MERFVKNRRISAVPNFYFTELIRNFNLVGLEDIRTASLEEIRSYGVDEMIEQGIALILDETDSHGLFFYMKDAVNTPYDMLLNCFPKKGYSQTHTIDELPNEIRHKFFNGVDSAVQAINDLSICNNENLSRIFVLQHIGPGEADHIHDYSTTYTQTHWHIYGVPYSYYQISNRDPLAVKEKSFIHAFWDPTVILAFDLLRERYPEAEIEFSTSSIKIIQRDLGLRITLEERKLLTQIMKIWKSEWISAAKCFTNFRQDNYGRYIPVEHDVRDRRVSEFVRQRPYLSNDSLFLLDQLVKNIRPAKGSVERSWNLFFKNINGSIGYTHNFTEGTTVLRVAPRSFVTKEKIGATDGSFYTKKDRNEEIDPDKKRHIYEMQRRLLTQVSEIYDDLS